MAEILWWLAQTSFTIAVLIVIVAMACRCLRRWPAVQHALWVVILVKLLTPPVVSWRWTARDLFPPSSPRDLVDTKLDVGDKIGPVSKTGSTAVPIRSPRDDVVWSNPQRPPAAVEDRLSAEATSTPAPISWTQTGIPALFGVWLLGGIMTLSCQLRSATRAKRLAAEGSSTPSRLQRQVEWVADALEIRAVPTRVSTCISSPFVCCLGRPILLWPESLCDELEKYHSVIAHELAHVKRKDHWTAWLVLFAGCLWWWNPLFWFLRRRIAETAEIACDALALSVLPHERTQFAEALLHLSQRVAETKTPAPALGAGTGKRQTFKRRFSMILNDRVNAKLPKTGLVTALLLFLVALPAWAFREQDRPGGDDSSTRTAASRQPAKRGAAKPVAARPAYSLDKDELIKRIAPPFPKARDTFTRGRTWLTPGTPFVLYLHWNPGGVKLYGEGVGSSGSQLPTLVRMLMKVYPQEIEGDKTYLKEVIPGDFIVRPGAPPAKVAAQLESILRKELKWKVKLTFREVERKVFVAKGTYKFTQIPGRPKRVEIYSTALTDPRFGGGGSGDFPKFLKWVGMWIKRPVTADGVKATPKSLRWHYNNDYDKLKLATDPRREGEKNPKLVLKNLTPQTGLTFTEEKRKIRVLFVERTKK
jgi:beta-lactamase regulating signal transducer with metallopeptidase domain